MTTMRAKRELAIVDPTSVDAMIEPRVIEIDGRASRELMRQIAVGALRGGIAFLKAQIESQHGVRVAPSSDMRFMLETLSQISRAHSESLQSLANAQAEWIKMLATAKQIPRNAAPPSPMQLGPCPATELADPEPWWAQLLKPQTLAGVTGLLRNVAPWFGFKSAPEEPKRRNAGAMPHLGNLKSVPRIEASSKPEASALPDFAEHMAAVCALVPVEHVAVVRTGLFELQRSNNFIDMLLFLSKPPVEAAAWVIEELVTKPAAKGKSS